jgi:hypothetical protein
MQRKQQLGILLVIIAMGIVSWAMSKVYRDIGNPFVPQHGTGLLPDSKPAKCWAVTLRADGTYTSVEAPCKHPEKKQ